MRGWKDIVLRTWSEFNSDHIAIIAAGVTFNILLAIFPALGAFVALYGLFGDITQVPRQLGVLAVLLPHDIVTFIGGEMLRLAHARTQGLSLALAAGLAISLWSANGAMRAIFVGMNIAYGEIERRGFIRLALVSSIFSLCLIAFLAAVLAALEAGAVAGAFLGRDIAWAVNIARWPILFVAFIAGLSFLYRYGPSRPHARWRWITWGAAAATVLWLAATLLFSLYVSRFAHLDRTYGSLGTAVGLMVWIWLSSISILIGAELNAEIERQAGVVTHPGGRRATASPRTKANPAPRSPKGPP